jgi:hypothetical protein
MRRLSYSPLEVSIAAFVQDNIVAKWSEDAPRLVPHDPSRCCLRRVQACEELVSFERPQEPLRIAQTMSSFARWVALDAEGYRPILEETGVRLPDNIPESVHTKVKYEYCASVTVTVLTSENSLCVDVSVFRVEQDCP